MDRSGSIADPWRDEEATGPMGDGDFVWSGDDSDRPDDGTSGEDDPRGNRAGDDECESPFGDLLDRIEGEPHRIDEADEIADLLSPGDATGSTDIDRLLDRIGGTMGSDRADGAIDPDASDAPGIDGRRGVDRDPTRQSRDDAVDRPGEAPTSMEERPEFAGEGDDREDAVEAGGDERGEAGPTSGSPFEDLLDRVEREVGGRDGRGRPGAAGTAADSWAFPGDAGSLPDDASGVLVLGSGDDADDFDACLSIVRETTDPRRTNLLLVWLSRDVTGRLERLYERYAGRSTDVTVVCRSKVEQSLRAQSAIPADGLEGNLTIERISDPRDLPKLGIAISRAIGNSAVDGKRTVMCFHSITDLLQFASHERVFRFLHVLQGRIDSIDATAYYHIDRDAHEDRTVATFWNLFDATIDLAAGPDG